MGIGRGLLLLSGRVNSRSLPVKVAAITTLNAHSSANSHAFLLLNNRNTLVLTPQAFYSTTSSQKMHKRQKTDVTHEGDSRKVRIETDTMGEVFVFDFFLFFFVYL